MSYVFVSHANPDKKKIRHIVDALIAAGEKIWLDNPAAMGFGEAEINQHFHRIKAGGRWRDEIDEALRTAGAVLVCWSERAKEDRKVWQSEATYARVEKKLVACRIDDVDPTALPDDYAAEQMPDLRLDFPGTGRTSFMGMSVSRQPRPPAEVEATMRLLLQDVRIKLSGRAGLRIAGRPLRDPFMPFLINRTDQESVVGGAIEDVAAEAGVRPFVIAGPENECLDEFLERLRRHTSPQRLRNGAWHEITVEWPSKRAPSEFATEFSRRLARQLGLPERSTMTVIAKALAERDRPVAVVSLMRAEEWELAEPKRINAWLSLWQSLGEDAHRVSVLPILTLTMSPAEPGWTTCPSGTCPGATVSNRQIWSEVQGLQAANRGLTVFSFLSPKQKPLPGLAAPPVLHPVRKGDAARWLSERFEMMSVERDEAKAIIDRVFGTKSAATHGVSLSAFATAVKPLFGVSR